MQNLIGVIDQENKAVLCFTKTVTCANSVSLGFVNGHVFVYPSSLPWRAKEIESLDLKKPLMLLEGKFTELPEHLITEKYLQQRELATLRALYINSLEVYFKGYMARTQITIDDSVYSFMHQELQTSDPKTDTYANGIIEYAAISDISNESAYQELKLFLDSVGLIKLRNMAWYNKYVRIINSLTTREQMKAAFAKIYNEIYKKALI